ncbi:MAG TPA: aldo/keto reductase [Acidimicrobiales bacterium]
MELRRFGRTEMEVSSIALGAMNFGSAPWGCSEEDAAQILRVYRDAGGNLVDTANIYANGESERILGRLIAGCRDELLIASKVGFPVPGGHPPGVTAARVRESLVATLQRLATDHLDLLQLHAFDARVPLDETLGALSDLVAEGLIRFAGSSNYFAWQLAEADRLAGERAVAHLASTQLMYNLVRRDIEREHLPYARSTELAVIAYGPLHGGHLAAGWLSRAELAPDSRALANPDVYLADEDRLFAVTRALVEHSQALGVAPGRVALAWVVRNPDVSTTLTAARTANELTEQLEALTLDADDAFWRSLDAATALPESYPSDFYDRLAGRS